jgi:hypothetical protein
MPYTLFFLSVFSVLSVVKNLMVDIICIFAGIIAMVGGLSGTMILKGAHSSLLYALLGAVVLTIGAVRVSRR